MGDVEDMLRELGLPSVDALFADIPAQVAVKELDIAPGLSEREVRSRIVTMLRRNESAETRPSFFGGGLYDHYIPASVRAITGRSEFYSAYTPYQAELSQGLLTALFEYQSLIAELTGLDVANTSMYDGSTALAEAALMARRVTRKREILIPAAMHWERKAVLRSYLSGADMVAREVPWDAETGRMDLEALASLVTDDTAAVYFENPSFLGPFEERVDEIRDVTKGMMIVGVNPLALAITKAPGDYGADIVVGEGQPLGIAMNFGGPLLGVFACRKEHVRKSPGRIIGMTQDANGDRAFCMTLITREQHIRREKAMSNICTNETLMAIAAIAYAAVIGGNGLRKVAAENVNRGRRLMDLINGVEGFAAPKFDGYHFNEFAVTADQGWDAVHQHLNVHGLQGGLSLGGDLPGLEDTALIATTEMHTDADQDRLVAALGEMF